MDVKMLTSMAGTNFSYKPGDVVALPDAVAQAWIAGGLAAANTPAAAIPHGKPAKKGKEKPPGDPPPAAT